MISFNNLGNLGRLGNQMFQYASLKGISRNRGFDFCIPPESVFGNSDPNVKNCATNIYNTFNISDCNQKLSNNRIIQESAYHFDEDLFNTCEDDVDLYGYFQSEKYFKHIENDIRKDFQFSDDLVNSCFEFISQVNLDKEVISIHVRRGDYLYLQSHHPTPSLEYYREALDKFPNVPVLIFSDDPDWCLNQTLFDDDRFLISQSNSADFDLCLMSMCKYHIIANSSFSWWGAWLSGSDKVIAPKDWFGNSLSEHDTSDLYCNGWEVV
jgi:hypothetical protein